MLMPNQFREDLCEEAIHIFGFEHPYTIACFKMCMSTKNTEEEIKKVLFPLRKYYLEKIEEDA